MDFFGIGPLEILAIVLIIIILFPAREIGRTAKTAGRMLRDLYRSETWRVMRSASDQIQHLPATLAREAELDDLRSLQHDVRDATAIPPDSLTAGEPSSLPETTPPASDSFPSRDAS
jgi:Sec-independent protein translocase protein TatA